MKTSEKINELCEALSISQGEMKNPEKNKTAKIPTKNGGKYEYNYADLPGSFDCNRAILAKNGLSHSSSIVHSEKGAPLLVMRLFHKSGQWIESEYQLPGNVDDKSLCASFTYGRRYLFSALTGIAGDEDTDDQPESEGSRYSERKRDQTEWLDQRYEGPMSESFTSEKRSPNPISKTPGSIVKPITPSPIVPSPKPVVGAPVAVSAPVTPVVSSATAVAPEWKPGFQELAEVQGYMGGKIWTTEYFIEYLKRNFQKTRLSELNKSQYHTLIHDMAETGESRLNPPNFQDIQGQFMDANGFHP